MNNRLSISVVGMLALLWASLSSAESLVLTIATAQGEEVGVVTIELFSSKAPNHVARIKRLTKEGHYNGVAFHRVIKGFMAQTGDVKYGNTNNFNSNKAGTGGSDYEDLKAELSEFPFTAGVVGMARSRYIHSANSQFFIMTESHSSLNGQYTVIGRVFEGMDIVRLIKKGSSSQNGKVSQPDYIKNAVIVP